jgi:hydrogenase maturation protease
MTGTQNKILVLALGNDIMGDDAAGLIASRELKNIFEDKIDVFELASAGFALIDILEGYEKVLILDSVPAETGSAGKIKELTKDSFSNHISWSPHYAGLPEMIALAKKLEINFPEEIRIIVMEIEKSDIIREGLNPEIQEQIPEFVERSSAVLNKWLPKEAVVSGLANQFVY